MNIKEQEKSLFREWQAVRNYEHFVSDGIFDPQAWNDAPIKITYILKEANWENATVDLCKCVTSGDGGQYWRTWNNVTRWTMAILRGGEYPREITEEDRREWLRKVSFLNLKKVGGDRQADNNEIREFAERDAEFIRRQLELYRPDLIICCGRGKWSNADLMHHFVLSNKTDWITAGTPNIAYFYTQFSGKDQSTPVVSFYHPQRRASHQTFEDWFKVMRQIPQSLL